MRRIFRATRQMPPLRNFTNFLMRAGRNWFWALRPAYMRKTDDIPADYIKFVRREIEGESFTLVETGCGDGRVLLHLTGQYSGARFIGIDLQKSAIVFGNEKTAARAVLPSHLQLICGSYLDDQIPLDCDYLISRAALIYLDFEQMTAFLQKRLPQIRGKLLLQEIVSTTGKTERSHFFANPIAEMIEEAAPGQFRITQEILDYGPWQGEAWTGANITATRIAMQTEA